MRNRLLSIIVTWNIKRDFSAIKNFMEIRYDFEVLLFENFILLDVTFSKLFQKNSSVFQSDPPTNDRHLFYNDPLTTHIPVVSLRINQSLQVN